MFVPVPSHTPLLGGHATANSEKLTLRVVRFLGFTPMLYRWERIAPTHYSHRVVVWCQPRAVEKGTAMDTKTNGGNIAPKRKAYSAPKLIPIGNAIQLIAGGNSNGGDFGGQRFC